jgi:hypothetical protein
VSWGAVGAWASYGWALNSRVRDSTPANNSDERIFIRVRRWVTGADDKSNLLGNRRRPQSQLSRYQYVFVLG